MAQENIVPNAFIEARVLNNMIREFMPLYMRKRWVLNEMKKRGRITRATGGKRIEWRPTFKRRKMRASPVNPTNISFPRQVDERQAFLNWRHGDIGESYNLFDELVEAGEHAWFRNAVSTTKRLVEDAMETLCDWFYLDGNTAGSYHWNGLESIFSTTGLVSGSPVGALDGTYAQLSQVLQYYGGTWTGNWPDGTGDPQYCAWTPIVCDATNDEFGTTNLWSANWKKAINYTLTFQETLAREKPDVLLMATDWHRQVKDSLTEYFNIELTNGAKDVDVFKDARPSGVQIVSEYGIPAETCYGLCFSGLEIKYLSKPGTPDQLLFQDEDKDISASQRLFALQTFSNMVVTKPGSQSKICAITEPGT